LKTSNYGIVGPRTQAAAITIFNLQLDLLHKYYVMTFLVATSKTR